MGLDIVVVEEGYFRPGFATFELEGVNGLSETLERFIWQPLSKDLQFLNPDECKHHFFKTCWHASIHYMFLCLRRGRFPNYQHHRETSILFYIKYWLNSWKVKLLRSRVDHELFESIRNSKNRFFFVPLQHEEDEQITRHSSFQQVNDFLGIVIRSFAKHGLSDDLLLFKQHPMSRGGVGHEKFIHDLASNLGIGHRVFCLWDGHNPSILDACEAVLLINSSIGFQALQRGKPVKALGQAVYDLQGIASQQTLEEFWIKPQMPDHEMCSNFLQQLKHLTQVPCSIYANANEPWPFLNTQ
jgi:capsular polysaccharide export protein